MINFLKFFKIKNNIKNNINNPKELLSPDK